MTKTDQLLLLIFVLVVMVIAGCTGGDTKEQGMATEEIRSLYEQVMEKATVSPDSALLLIESFRNEGLLPDYRSELLRAKVYAQTVEGMRLDSAIIIGERLMTIDEAKKDLAYRQDVLEMLVNACHQHHDDELTLFYCKRLMELRRQQGEETEALRNEVEIGMILAATGHEEEGLAKIDSVINLLNGKRKLKEMNVCLFALQHKITVVNNAQGTMHNAQLGNAQCTMHNAQSMTIVDCASQMLGILADYEKLADELHAGMKSASPTDLSPDFIDFLRSWAYVFMANAYAKLNDKEKANEYLALYESTKRAHSYEGRKDIAPIYRLMGEFDKMDAIHAEEEARLRVQNDTISDDYAAILHDRAMAAEAQGRYAEAFRLCKEYETLVKTLNERLLQSKAKLYAARYHALEQQREAERQKAAKKNAYVMAGFISVVALLSVWFAIYAIRQRRKTERKNRVLAREIAEAIEYKEKYYEQTHPQPLPAREGSLYTQDGKTSEEKTVSGHIEDVTTPLPLKDGPEDGLSGYGIPDDPVALFNYIARVIRDERLYLNPLFGSQDAADRFSISSRRIGTAITQGSKYKSLPGLIRSLRLEHACRLLTTQPEMTIRQVGEASGFSNNSTFCSDFLKMYEITPTVYRQLGCEQ